MVILFFSVTGLLSELFIRILRSHWLSNGKPRIITETISSKGMLSIDLGDYGIHL